MPAAPLMNAAHERSCRRAGLGSTNGAGLLDPTLGAPGDSRRFSAPRERVETPGARDARGRLSSTVGPVHEVVTATGGRSVEVVSRTGPNGTSAILTSEIEELRSFATEASPRCAPTSAVSSSAPAAAIAWDAARVRVQRIDHVVRTGMSRADTLLPACSADRVSFGEGSRALTFGDRS